MEALYLGAWMITDGCRRATLGVRADARAALPPDVACPGSDEEVRGKLE
jgi:hypothetical protein